MLQVIQDRHNGILCFMMGSNITTGIKGAINWLSLLPPDYKDWLEVEFNGILLDKSGKVIFWEQFEVIVKNL